MDIKEKNIKLIDEVKNFFEDNNFYVSYFHFEHIIPDKEFRDNIIKNYQKSIIAQILLFSPELFIMGKKEKANCIFFAICIYDIRDLDDKRIKILKNYYPPEQIVIFFRDKSIENNKNLFVISLGELEHIDSKRMTINEFINYIVG